MNKMTRLLTPFALDQLRHRLRGASPIVRTPLLTVDATAGCGVILSQLSFMLISRSESTVLI